MPRIVQFPEIGAPSVMQIADAPVPVPGAGQARVRIQTIGVNFIDTYHRSGLYPVALPFTPGVEAAGIVDEIGPAIKDMPSDADPFQNDPLAVGDRVAWTMIPGTYADFACVPLAQLVRVPNELSCELAAATLLQGMTAHYLTHGVRQTQPGDQALVHAAAGGTGGLLVQFLKRAGARVLATCSTEEKAALARESGADEVILYSQEDFRARTRDLTDGRGVDVVYDSVGATTFEGSLGSLRPRGLLCLFGQASGPVPAFDLGRLNGAGSLFVTRPSLGHYIADRPSLAERAGEVFSALASGALQQRIGGRYALTEAVKAHEDLEGRGTTGKLVLTTES